MRETVRTWSAILVVVSFFLNCPRCAQADGGQNLPCLGEMRLDDVVSLIRPGMSYEKVNRLLGEEPGCFGHGPEPVGPKDNACWYLRAGVLIDYTGGRVQRVKRFETVQSEK